VPDDTPAAQVLRHDTVRTFFQELADRLWASGSGSASRPARLHLLAEPPSIDAGEATDKGSINQKAVLERRHALVEMLHSMRDGHHDVILPRACQRAAA
jgi:feruloyl-CoA synthase